MHTYNKNTDNKNSHEWLLNNVSLETGFTHDEQGQVWPYVGAEASFILVDASCSAEAVARLPKREAVYYQGKMIYNAQL